MSELVFLLAGIALQLGGVALTIVGARTVWKDIKSPDDRFLAPFVRAWRWFVARVRRLLRRPGRQVIGVGAASVVASAGKVRAYTSPGELPDGLSTDEAVQLLSKQLRDTIPQVYTTMFALNDELAAKIEAVQTERMQLAQVLDERAEQERQRAVGGLRMEAYGFILLTLGTLVQAFGSYLGIELPLGG